ncbi:MAG: ankyrin repeat domain-containing protein [Candidatus Sedimenticola sp. (ex Thyasira tokunagai)]
MSKDNLTAMNHQQTTQQSPKCSYKSIRLWLLVAALLLLSLLSACGNPDQPTIGLYLAIQRGDIDQIERHIAWKTDINSMDSDGRRPLHVAAGRGRYVITKLLIDNRADINAGDRNGKPALYHAVLSGRTQIAELLVKRGADPQPDKLLDEVVNESVADRDIIPLLLKWGADIDHRDAEGRTPMMRAIIAKQRVLVKLLIANGADVNAENSRGHRPLDIANRLQDRDIIRLLHRNGARPSDKTEE